MHNLYVTVSSAATSFIINYLAQRWSSNKIILHYHYISLSFSKASRRRDLTGFGFMMCVIYKQDVPNSFTTPKTDVMRVMQQAYRDMFGRDWTELASCVDTCRVRKKKDFCYLQKLCSVVYHVLNIRALNKARHVDSFTLLTKFISTLHYTKHIDDYAYKYIAFSSSLTLLCIRT